MLIDIAKKDCATQHIAMQHIAAIKRCQILFIELFMTEISVQEAIFISYIYLKRNIYNVTSC